MTIVGIIAAIPVPYTTRRVKVYIIEYQQILPQRSGLGKESIGCSRQFRPGSLMGAFAYLKRSNLLLQRSSLLQRDTIAAPWLREWKAEDFNLPRTLRLLHSWQEQI